MTVIVLILFYAPYIVFTLSVLFTILHGYEEIVANVPIWRYLRLPVSDMMGFIGLTLFSSVQVVLAAYGYIDNERLAYWLLLVIRLSDCLISHWLPWVAGRRPNPGLATTPLYVIESVLIVAILVRVFM